MPSNITAAVADSKRVWLIASNGDAAAEFGPGTLALAEDIRAIARELAADRPLAVTLEPAGGVSAADAQDTFDAVNRIYRTCRLPAADVIADFTGGTKPMTVGVVMAGLAPDRSLQYVSFHAPTKTSHGPFLIESRAEAFNLSSPPPAN